MSLEEEFHREMEAIYQISATRNYRLPTFYGWFSNMVALRRQGGF